MRTFNTTSKNQLASTLIITTLSSNHFERVFQGASGGVVVINGQNCLLFFPGYAFPTVGTARGIKFFG